MRVNVLGNGDHAYMFKRGTPGKLLICNMPPFEIPTNEVYASVMVDFKMMNALTKGEINLDMYDWVLGTRPRKWMEMRPDFYLKYAYRIKGFHQHVPKYAKNATNFTCGHMAMDYACRKMKATECHVYGFDSMFDMNLRSYSDLILESDRSATNTHRLANNWRPIWTHMFKEFSDIKFYLYHSHPHIKIEISDNVEIVVEKKTKEA
jgi:hypothetical protein